MNTQPLLWSTVDTVSDRKHRGAFFTPPHIAQLLSDWAIRTPLDRVLEPSCGEASFLLAAARTIAARTQHHAIHADLVGFDIHPNSVLAAKSALATVTDSADIRQADFFDVAAFPEFDVVLGNPPFIRYQSFVGDNRSKGLRASLAAGVNLTGLASSWAPFLIHATQFLKRGGRLGFVLPAELLAVKYAEPVRRFLMRRFASVKLVVFEKLLFAGALEDVVLLLAEGEGGCDHFDVYPVRDAAGITLATLGKAESVVAGNGTKWTQALVQQDAWREYQSVLATPQIEVFGAWGSAYLGAVTGNNSYFALSDAEVEAARLDKRDLVPVSPPGSRHLRGLDFSEAAWNSERRAGKKCWLFYPRQQLSSFSEAYIKKGAAKRVDKAYKCASRTPWYRVPLVPTPDLLLTYMDADRPRLTANGARVRHLNSLYGVTLKQGRKVAGKELLPVATLNTVTLLGAEIVGRSYGGGLLKLEPREAEQLPVPSFEVVMSISETLRALRPQMASSLRQGKLGAAVAAVDKAMWEDTGLIEERILAVLRDAREFLYRRRMNRGKR